MGFEPWNRKPIMLPLSYADPLVERPYLSCGAMETACNIWIGKKYGFSLEYTALIVYGDLFRPTFLTSKIFKLLLKVSNKTAP